MLNGTPRIKIVDKSYVPLCKLPFEQCNGSEHSCVYEPPGLSHAPLVGHAAQQKLVQPRGSWRRDEVQLVALTTPLLEMLISS